MKDGGEQYVDICKCGKLWSRTTDLAEIGATWIRCHCGRIWGVSQGFFQALCGVPQNRRASVMAAP